MIRVKYFYLSYVLLMMVFVVVMASLEMRKPDNYFFELIVNEPNKNDRRLLKLKRQFAKIKIRLLGFSDKCNLYSASQEKYPAIYSLSTNITATKTDKRAILNAIESLGNLGCSVNVYAKDAGSLPIHSAILWGDIDLLELLLKLGADINLVLRRGTHHRDAISFTELIIKDKKDKRQPYFKQVKILERLKKIKGVGLD